ncbi:MAG: antitoxin HicB [Ignavibacteriae bacterium HGW-Ignavibacteriae-1]|jgi:predicted RNase H-like HicB family nuclease|nr:MAG: antitoxin HicB [Ignavibacteriae bacterium HGW-Ignavibacteriae-1]
MTYNNYKVLLRPEPEGGFTVLVPSLPGCISYGSTLSEAKVMAKEAIELYLESLSEHNESIPNDNETLEYSVMVESYA